MTAEAEPVAAGDLADIADRAASDQPGQLEDLGHRQDLSFACVLGPGATDSARVAREELVVLHRGRQDGADQPVCLGRHGDGHAVGQECGAPFPDLPSRQLPNRYAAEVRLNVLTEQPPVQVHGPRAQPGPFGDPGGSVVAELHLPAFRIGPLARSDLGFDHDERPVGVALSLVSLRARAHRPVRSRISDLVAPGFTSADVAETSVSISVRHYATPLIFCRVWALA